MTQQNTTQTIHRYVCVTDDEPCPPSDEATISGLMESESHHMPERDYLQRCRDRVVDTTARLDAINWILKVRASFFITFRLDAGTNERLIAGNAGAGILSVPSSNGVSLY